MDLDRVELIKKVLLPHKDRIRRDYGVNLLGVFGSSVRGDFRPDSDVDILIEVEKPIGFKFFELWDELESLLGIKVDLVRESLLKEEIKEYVIKDLLPL
ncbi:nucleotidyltransferase family protein [Hydrogenobaculum sp.]